MLDGCVGGWEEVRWVGVCRWVVLGGWEEVRWVGVCRWVVLGGWFWCVW
jgi:hypothetical protein